MISTKLSFAEFVIDEIENAYYFNEHKARLAIINQFIQDNKITSNHAFIIKYKQFRYANLVLDVTPDPSYVITQEVKDLIELWMDNHKKFRYDIDKLKNFISFLLRNSKEPQDISRYIPDGFTDNFTFRPSVFSTIGVDNLDEIVNDRFKEEINLIKRYYLLVKLKQME